MDGTDCDINSCCRLCRCSVLIELLLLVNYTVFFIRKPFLYLSLNFLSITLEIRLRFSEYFFLTLISLFSLNLYLIRFNTNNRLSFFKNGEAGSLNKKKR